MFKDIIIESVVAFKKLTQDYSEIDEALLEKEFQFLKGINHPLNDAHTILSKITGFGENCPLCKAIDTQCNKCIYSLHNKDNEFSLYCVDPTNQNFGHYNTIMRSYNGKELKTALDNKVKFMKKFLIKYEERVMKGSGTNITILEKYQEQLAAEKRKQVKDRDTILAIQAKITNLKKRIK